MTDENNRVIAEYRGIRFSYKEDTAQLLQEEHGIDILSELKAAIDQTVKEEYALMSAEIYTKTKTHCGYCVKAKALLEQYGIPYREISVEDNRDECFDRVREATGSDPKTAPQIFIDGEYIGGHDQLVEWLR